MWQKIYVTKIYVAKKIFLVIYFFDFQSKKNFFLVEKVQPPTLSKEIHPTPNTTCFLFMKNSGIGRPLIPVPKHCFQILKVMCLTKSLSNQARAIFRTLSNI